MDSQKDYYAVLGVEPTASKDRLHAAWRKLVEHHHPDRWAAHGPDRAREATRRTQEINEAWQVLSDDQRRLEYDRLRTLRLLHLVGWRAPSFSPVAAFPDDAVSMPDDQPVQAPDPPPPDDASPLPRPIAVAGAPSFALSGDDGPPRRTPWGVPAILATLLFAVAANLLGLAAAIGSLLALKGSDFSDNDEAAALLLATVVADAVIVLAIWRFLLRPRRLSFRALGFRGFGRPEAGQALVGFVAAWALIVAYTVGIDLVGLDELLPESTVGDEAFSGLLPTVIAGIAVLVAAPLAEEAVFRGFIFAGLMRWGFWPAALLSGILFSAVHFDPGSLVPFAMIGVLLAWLYYRTNSLWTAVAMHFTFNLLGFVISVATA